MIVVVPTLITDAAYTGGNLEETDHSEWASGTTYTRGTFVRISANHGIYQCLRDHDADNSNSPVTEAAAVIDPLTEDPDPLHWVYVSRTNKWKLFDSRPSQQAANANTITASVTIQERISAVAVLELDDCTSAEVELEDSDGNTLWQDNISLLDRSAIHDWFSYYFAVARLADSFIRTTLPVTSPGDVLTVRLSGGPLLKCGQILIGFGDVVAETHAGESGFEGLDYSHVETNIYGDLVTVQRAATTIYHFDLRMRVGQLNQFAFLMKQLRGGKTALWIGDQTEGVRGWAYGFWRDYRVYYSDGVFAHCRLTVQGVV